MSTRKILRGFAVLTAFSFTVLTVSLSVGNAQATSTQPGFTAHTVTQSAQSAKTDGGSCEGFHGRNEIALKSPAGKSRPDIGSLKMEFVTRRSTGLMVGCGLTVSGSESVGFPKYMMVQIGSYVPGQFPQSIIWGERDEDNSYTDFAGGVLGTPPTGRAVVYRAQVNWNGVAFKVTFTDSKTRN